jgi:cell division protease FtsH
MLIVNWVVAGSLSTTKTTTLNVPYSIFRAQVDQRNVATVTATGETIAGTFRNSVSYPPGKNAKVSKDFKTERPVFANDQIFQ